MNQRDRLRFKIAAGILLFGVGAGLLVAAVAFWFGWMAPQRSIAAASAAIRESGEPITLADIETWYPPIPDSENAAIPLRRAFATFRDVSDPALPVPLLNKLDWPEWPPRGQELDGATRVAIDAVLTENAECLALIHEAHGLPKCRFNTLRGVEEEATHPDLQGLRSLGSLLAIQALALADDGKCDEALMAVETGIWLSETIRQEPDTMARLVGGSMRAEILRSLEHVLSRSAVSSDELRGLQEKVEACYDPDLLYRVLVGERCRLVDSINGGKALIPINAVRKVDLSFGISVFEELMASSKLESTLRHRKYEELEAKYFDPSIGTLKSMTTFTSFMHITPLTHLDVAHDFQSADIFIAQAASGVERFRVKTGKLPERLEDLVPEYLAAVPVDPFDGLPIRFLRRDCGFAVYSVGFDREDDGGSDPEEHEKKERMQCDIVFVVNR